MLLSHFYVHLICYSVTFSKQLIEVCLEIVAARQKLIMYLTYHVLAVSHAHTQIYIVKASVVTSVHLNLKRR